MNTLDRFLCHSQQSKENEAPAGSTSQPNESKATRDCDDDSTTDEDVISNKRRKVYPQKFRSGWKSTWSWLQDKNGAFCTLCNKSLTGGRFHLARHANSLMHKKYSRAVSKVPSIKALVSDTRRNTVTSELKFLMFVVEHNISMNTLEHLPKLIRSVCPDSEIAKEIKCSHTKGTKIVKEHLGPSNFKSLCDVLKTTKFSLIVDETTDIATEKCLALVVRYFDRSSHAIVDDFFALVCIKDSTAEGIYQAIKSIFEKDGIPLSNMIGFAADNCSTMMGAKGGVQAKLKSQIDNLFVLGCVCHSMHLCASAACQKLPSTVEDLARDIYAYFSYSSKRLHELKEFQNFVKIEPHKILKMSQTRWLSVELVVNRILEQWPALELFFTQAALEDNLQAAKCILNALRSSIYKVYFTFLSFILSTVNKINLLFQGTKPTLTNLITIFEKYYKSILKCFLKNSYVDSTSVGKIDPENVHQYLPVEKIYFGAKSEMILNNLSSQERQAFQTRGLSFYTTLCKEIRKRIDFSDPVLNSISVINPRTALCFEKQSLVPLFKLFPNLISEDKYEVTNSQWRLLAEYADSFSDVDHINVEDFWVKVDKIKDGDEYIFKDVFNFCITILSSPHSSASTERVFSHINLIKTKLRNHLQVETCNALLHTKNLLKGKNCYDWKPNELLIIRNCNMNVQDEIGTDDDEFWF